MAGYCRVAGLGEDDAQSATAGWGPVHGRFRFLRTGGGASASYEAKSALANGAPGPRRCGMYGICFPARQIETFPDAGAAIARAYDCLVPARQPSCCGLCRQSKAAIAIFWVREGVAAWVPEDPLPILTRWFDLIVRNP